MNPVELEQELSLIRSHYQSVSAVTKSASLFDIPATGNWSKAQHLYHLALTNSSLARLIPALLERRFGSETDEVNTERLEQLAQGFFPRGGTSPANLVPPDDLTKGRLVQELDSSLAAMNALEQLNFGPSNKFDHVYYGPLNAVQWLRFAQLHTKHHLELIETQT